MTPLRLVVWIICALALGWAMRADGQTPTPSTFNPLPADNASFFTALRTFLLGEDADRYSNSSTTGKEFGDVVFQGCTHATAAGMVGTFTVPCQAFVDGAYTVDPVASIDYAAQGATAADFCWVILHKDTTTAIGGWTRLAGTHYLTDCTTAAGTRPTRPANSTFVMGVTIAGSAITVVARLANDVPWVEMFTNSSEVALTRAGSFWMVDSGTGLLSYITRAAALATIPLSDASGCATCGDSATSFFSAGLIETARGGTNFNSSASTGVPAVAAGVWSVPARVSEALGGTDLDNSAATGLMSYQAGVGIVDNFPEITKELTPPAMAVDGVQCVQDDNATLATGVLANVITCADNSAGRIFAQFRLPTGYTTNAQIFIRLAGQNTAAAAGVTAFDVACMCDSTLDTSSAANFSAGSNLDFTWAGTDDEVLINTVAPTCGGTCAVGDLLTIKFTVDDTATTYVTVANVKYILASIRAVADGM